MKISLFPTRPAPLVALSGLILAALITGLIGADAPKPDPEPKVIDPGPVGGPPSDAVVLFDGKDLSKWQGGDKWPIQDGYAISKETGITSHNSFGDCQLHVEWATPSEVKGSGQGRGNSGIYLMQRYEIQVLD